MSHIKSSSIIQGANKVQQWLYDHLSVQQQEQLINYIVQIMLTPLQNNRITQITNKFRQAQMQIISVVQHRVRLQQYLQIQKVKQQHLQKVFKLYQMMKQRDATISELGRINGQLDAKYLYKVNELQQLRIQKNKLDEELRYFKTKYNKKRENNINMANINSNLMNLTNLQSHINNCRLYSEQNQTEQMIKLQQEIISLKQTFNSYFRNSIDNKMIMQQVINVGEQVEYNKNKQKSYNQNKNEQSILNNQIKLLRQSLKLRLSIIEQQNDISQKYEQSQKQIINSLMQQLIKLKTGYNNLLSVNSNLLLNQTMQNKTYLSFSNNKISSLSDQYINSNTNIDKLLQQQLIHLNSQLQFKSVQLQNYSKSIHQFKQQINSLNSIILSKNKQIQQFTVILSDKQRCLQKLQSTYKQQINKINLQFNQKYKALQIMHAQSVQQKDNQILRQVQKIQKLKQQIHLLNQQINSIYCSSQNNYKKQYEQIIKTKQKQIQNLRQSIKNIKELNKQLKQINQNLNQNNEKHKNEIQNKLKIKESLQIQIQRLKQSNQSLSNQKILLKTLNLQLNKQKNQANEEKRKINEEYKRVNEQYKRIHEQYQKVNEENKKQNEENIKMNQQHRKLKEQNRRIKQQVQKLTTQLIQVRANNNIKNENRIKQRREMNEKLQQSQQTIKELKLQLSIKVDQLTNKNNQINQLQIKLKQKQSKLTQLKLLQQVTFKSNLNQTESNQLSQKNESIFNNQRQQYIALQSKSNQIQAKYQYLQSKEIQLQSKSKLLQSKSVQIQNKQSSINHQLQFIQNKNQQIQLKQLFLKDKQLQLQNQQTNLQNQLSNINQIKSALYQQKLSIQQQKLSIEQQKSLLQSDKLILSKQRQSLNQLKSSLHQLQLNIQLQRQQPLSPPPSPIQTPLQSPYSPSPLKLQRQSSNHINIQNFSQSVQTDLFNNATQNLNKVLNKRQQSNQNYQAISSQNNSKITKIDKLCKSIADQWMKTQQQKWNIIHYQIDSIVQLILNNNL